MRRREYEVPWTVMEKSDSRYIKERMDTIIIVTVAVLSYLYFWDFDEQG